jgi:hypothetical protein
MNKSKLGVIAIVTLLLLSLSVSLVAAQYTTQKTTAVTISSDGTFTASEPDVGVSYAITGTPGASGTVTADVYSGNPQATASIPNGTSLTHFIAITFNMNANDFSQATINITYTDSDVQNIQSPYAVYKYISNTNSYVALPSTVDTATKTITVTLLSIDDPLLAIGGATSTSGGLQAVTWAIVIVSVIAIVLVAVLVVSRMRHPATNPEVDYQS